MFLKSQILERLLILQYIGFIGKVVSCHPMKINLKIKRNPLFPNYISAKTYFVTDFGLLCELVQKHERLHLGLEILA